MLRWIIVLKTYLRLVAQWYYENLALLKTASHRHFVLIQMDKIPLHIFLEYLLKQTPLG